MPWSRRAIGVVVASLPLVAVGLAFAPAVRGACGLTSEAIAAAPVAFVGSLTAVSPDGLTGTFRVEDVWRGSTLQIGGDVDVAVADGGVPATVQMPPDGSPQRFLVLASITNQGGLVTQRSCAIFAFPWDDSYADLRPADTLPLIEILFAAALIGIASVAAFRSRRAAVSA